MNSNFWRIIKHKTEVGRGGSRRVQDSVDKFSFLAKFDSVKFY